MKWSKLSRTTAFRLSLIYLSLFLTCFVVLGCAVYFFTCQTLDKQLKESLSAELSELQKVYDDGGISALTNAIKEREDITVWNAPDFALIDSGGHRLIGALPTTRYKPGFQIVSGPPEAGNPSENQAIYADAVILSGGYVLVAGEDSDYIEDFGETLLAAFSWGGIIVLILSLICGHYISRAFLKKAETIAVSTQKIIAGDISHRLTVSKSDDELDQLASVINLMLDKVNALVDDVRQVSSDIAHDLRTPISRLRQHLEEAQRQSLSVEQYREKISSSILELDTILNTFSGLLRIAQIEAGARKSEFKPVDLGGILTDVVDALLPVAEESGKSLRLELQDSGTIFGDKDLITQMVFNLIDNAIRHTSADNQIEVKLQNLPDGRQLIVSDTGPGIPEEYRDKVFQRFYRLEKSRSTPGNGLGLSIVKAIADIHGAKIVLSDNEPGLKVILKFLAG